MKKILSMMVSAALAASVVPVMATSSSTQDSETIFTEDFSLTKAEIVAKEQVQGVAVTKWDVVEDTTLGSQVVYIQDKDTTGGFIRTPQSDYSTVKSGTIRMSTKFMVNNVTNVEYYPLTFKTDKQIKTDNTVYDFAKTLYISGGKFVIANPTAPSDIALTTGVYTTTEVADVTANKWYDLEITLDIDGDATTFDSWSYSLKGVDGTAIANGENYVLGVSQGNNTYNFFDMTGITRFVFGYVGNKSADNDSIIYMDDVNIEEIITKEDDSTPDDPNQDDTTDETADETYLSETFSGTKNDLLDRIQARAVTGWNVMNDTALNSQIVYIQKNVKGSGFLRTPTADYETPVYGNIEMKAKFMVNNLTDVEYYPLSFESDKQLKSDDSIYDFAKMIYIQKGKFMIANPEAPSDIAATNGIYTTTEVADVTANKWYDLTVNLNVDGDATTFDTWSYSLKDIEGKTIADGEDYVLGIALGNSEYNYFDLVGIDRFILSYIGNSSAVDSIMYMDDVSIIKKLTPPEVNKIDVDTTVAERPVIDITFNQEMNAETFAGITVKDGDGNAANIEISPVSGASKICKITFLSDLLYETEYTVKIPETVTTPKGAALSETTESFTTPKFRVPVEETYLSEDFSQNKTEILAKGEIGRVGLTAWDVTADSVLNNQVVYIKKTGLGQTAGAGFLRTPDSADYTSPLYGNIQMQAKFMVNNIEDVVYYPLSLKTDKQIKIKNEVYDFAKMIYIANGKFKIENPAAPSDITTTASVYNTEEVADAEANKWYDLTINLNVDGDATTFDTWSYSLKDIEGKTIACGEDYVLGISQGNAEYNYFDMAGITRFIMSYIDNSEDTADSTMYMDDVSIVKLKTPTVSASVTDGASDVSVSKDITVTFSQPVNAEGFDRITLTKGEENVLISARPATGYTKTCTITFAENLDFNRDYVLNIPQMETEYKVYSETLNITFRTEIKKNPVTVEKLTINGGSDVVVSAGEKITVNADFVNNNTSSAEDAALIVAVYNSEGTMYGVTYKNTSIEAGRSAPLAAEITVPAGIGNDAYVAVYAWNSISSMTPISDVIIKP